jgi:hypothetical protein
LPFAIIFEIVKAVEVKVVEGACIRAGKMLRMLRT